MDVAGDMNVSANKAALLMATLVSLMLISFMRLIPAMQSTSKDIPVAIGLEEVPRNSQPRS